MAMQRRRPARSRPWQRRLGLGFRREGEGEGEQGVTGCSFIRQGGPWSEERPRAPAIVAAVSSLSPQEEDADREGPLLVFNLFLLFSFPGKFRQLIEDLNHF